MGELGAKTAGAGGFSRAEAIRSLGPEGTAMSWGGGDQMMSPTPFEVNSETGDHQPGAEPELREPRAI
jgi:predicted phage tail protein